jgi:hypothetical protein
MNPAPTVDLEVVEHAPRLRCDFFGDHCHAPAVYAYRFVCGRRRLFRCAAHRVALVSYMLGPAVAEEVIP